MDDGKASAMADDESDSIEGGKCLLTPPAFCTV